mmetsp:Transcript_48381/g.113147  ORF Transcript_48381/g.113147 Transcript_48381/m.113147 type:complete len:340 (+) Transcript_48381:3420-4439(+)
MPVRQRLLGSFHQLRHLDRHAELLEEALVRAPELRHEPDLRLHANLLELVLGVYVALVSHAPKIDARVVLARLRFVGFNFNRFELARLVGENARQVHAPLLHVECDELHRARTAVVNRLFEDLKLCKWCARPPEPQATHVGHALDGRAASGGAVDHLGIGQRALQLEHAQACDRLLAAVGAQVLGAVRLVEDEPTVPGSCAVVRHPVHNLREASCRIEVYNHCVDVNFGAASFLLGLLLLLFLCRLLSPVCIARDEGGVGAEENTLRQFLEPGRREIVKPVDLEWAANLLHIAPRVVQQIVRDRDPQVVLAPAQVVLVNHSRHLPPLAHAWSVAQKESA